MRSGLTSPLSRSWYHAVRKSLVIRQKLRALPLTFRIGPASNDLGTGRQSLHHSTRSLAALSTRYNRRENAPVVPAMELPTGMASIEWAELA